MLVRKLNYKMRSLYSYKLASYIFNSALELGIAWLTVCRQERLPLKIIFGKQI